MLLAILLGGIALAMVFIISWKKIKEQIRSRLSIRRIKRSITLKGKKQFLLLLQKIRKAIVHAIFNLNPRLLYDDLFSTSSPRKLLEQMENIKQIFYSLQYPIMRSILTGENSQSDSGIKIPWMLQKIIKEAVDGICKEEDINSDSLLECLNFYDGDLDLKSIKQQFQKEVKEIIQTKIQQTMPQIPDYLNKDKVLSLSKRVIKRKCFDELGEYKKKFYQQKNDLKHTFNNFSGEDFWKIDGKLLAEQGLAPQSSYQGKVGQQPQEKVEKKTADTFSAAVLKYGDDQEFIHKYDKMQEKAINIMRKYEDKMNDGTLTLEELADIEKQLNYL